GGDAPCGCGGKGHLETLAAADAIERKARARGLPPDAEALWKRRDEEGPGAIWEETLDLLARGIASIVHLLDPEAVVLGGGMSRAEGLVEALQRRVEPCLASPLKGRVPLVAASLGDDAALLGAASLAVGMLRKEEEDV
ncbi:MAG: ROK family protein, partial [Synergistales bacterium]|nr:ROK family protein [Synergistales bacterium]